MFAILKIESVNNLIKNIFLLEKNKVEKKSIIKIAICIIIVLLLCVALVKARQKVFDNNYNEGLKTEQIEPLNSLNHYSLEDFIQQVAGFQKIYMNNFLSDENREVIDIDARNIQIFDADMDSVSKFLKEPCFVILP